VSIYNLISFLGIFALLLLAWLFSENKKKLNWRAIIVGLGLQFIFAFIVLVVIARIPESYNPFLILNSLVLKFITAATKGVDFVFGPLMDQKKMGGFILAIHGLPTIIFFSAFMALFYYLNIMPKIIKGFAWVFTKLMRISGAESLCGASNIFLGVESTFAVKPYLKDMTRSELTTVLTAGLATVASNVLVLYVSILKGHFPTIAGHLISASIISAPAALVLAKIIVPETQKPQTLGEQIEPYYEKENNLLEAIIKGANSGLQLIFGIVALLIAVLGFIGIADWLLGYLGQAINLAAGTKLELNLKLILGYGFWPITVVMGVPLKESLTVAQIIGQRVVATEVAGYIDLAQALSQGAISQRAAVITAYALCGFAHLASLSIFVGGIAALVPEKVKELSQIALRALLAATIACLLTGCLAGLFYSQQAVLFK
jgi:CNT family concentrative nucleoside transporter